MIESQTYYVNEWMESQKRIFWFYLSVSKDGMLFSEAGETLHHLG